MKILTGKEISRQIALTEPKKIAVAYIGADWKSFIENHSLLESVIVSPTPGSNPNAICELAGLIGWANVHFLDQLHAKIYLGQTSAVVASANLTNNGLDGSKLFECATHIDEADQLTLLDQYFGSLQKKAQRMYKSTHNKIEKIRELRTLWNLARKHKLAPDSDEVGEASEFQSVDNDAFYVMYYNAQDFVHTEALAEYESRISDKTNVREDDEDIKENRFVLLWEARGHQKTQRRPYWFYIHKIVSNGVEPEADGVAYTKALLQFDDENIPKEPFKITPEVHRNISRAISALMKPLYQYGEPWYSKKAIDAMPEFMKYVRGEK